MHLQLAGYPGLVDVLVHICPRWRKVWQKMHTVNAMVQLACLILKKALHLYLDQNVFPT